MKMNSTDRRAFLRAATKASLFSLTPFSLFPLLNMPLVDFTARSGESLKYQWQVGIGKRVITPQTKVWLAGYGYKRIPYGKVHDLFVKVMALKDQQGRVVVMATTDHQGMSKTIYERLYQQVNSRFNISRENFMLTFSHNHSGPRLTDDLHDYYPVDLAQEQLVDEYSNWMIDQVLEAVGEALTHWQEAEIFKGKGHCRFAVNRRENKESEVPDLLAMGRALQGPVDHEVPILALRGKGGHWISVLFGYACHPTTVSFHTWSGDYPGFAQINLEKALPGTAALFFNTCGGDQNPLPRRTMERCEKYGKMLSDAVLEALEQPMEKLEAQLSSAFSYVDLAYESQVTKEFLRPIIQEGGPIQARWARRMLAKIEAGEKLPTSYAYPVQAWKLGKGLLLIGIGGESVVDYSLKFKKRFLEQTTWVCGYANEMAAYIPSHRVWQEGGYEGGPHLDEYGHPAWRWAEDVEDRITKTVDKVVSELQ